MWSKRSQKRFWDRLGHLFVHFYTILRALRCSRAQLVVFQKVGSRASEYCIIFFRFHGCEDCNQKPAEKRMKFDDSKHTFLKTKGVLIVKKECEWRKELALLTCPTSGYFDILNGSSDEKSVLRGIKNGELFGFAKVSVRSPEAFIAKYE